VAGLLEQIDERHEGGIPLLSRVPVLGDLFGRNRRRRESSEFVVYLIAHVLRDDPRSAGRDEDLLADVRRLISSELAE
jgi:type II secretory pathway component GspD/PulD (secretin)